MTRTAPPPWEPADVSPSALPLRAAVDWPGAPRPVLAEDSLAALAAARWAARSASHHGTDVALAVLVPSGSGAGTTTHLDDARATAARLLPTVHAHGVRGHAVLVPVAPRASDRAVVRAQVRAVTRAAVKLDAPLLVLLDASDAPRSRRLCAALPGDVLLVPPRPDRGPLPAVSS